MPVRVPNVRPHLCDLIEAAQGRLRVLTGRPFYPTRWERFRWWWSSSNAVSLTLEWLSCVLVAVLTMAFLLAFIFTFLHFMGYPHAHH